VGRSKILFLGFVWPEWRSSGAGVRDQELIRLFLKNNFSVTYASIAKPNEYIKELEAMGVATHLITANDSAFDLWVKELAPDIVIFDRFIMEEQFSFRVREASPKSLRILDTIDLHFLRGIRQEKLKQGLALKDILEVNFEIHTREALRELGAVLRSDLTLVVSSFEMLLLKDRFKIASDLLYHLPFMIEPHKKFMPYEDRRNLAFIGNFRHPPNEDALHWIVSEIWPSLYPQLLEIDPEVKLNVYGAYPPRKWMERKIKGIEFLGQARDASEVLSQSKILFAPLRFGAGIKGKIAESWRVGTPVVTTGIGSEGMTLDPVSLDHSFGGRVEASVEGLIIAALELYRNKEAWQQGQNAGAKILEKCMNPLILGTNLIAHLETLKDNLDSRRKSNWLGELLWTDQYEKTKYFSRWLELKTELSARKSVPTSY
jgi:glycosyltransferase involved in cell wall biosynthesis